MKLLFLLIFLLSFQLHAKQYKVAVIDTGIDPLYSVKANLCKTGHKTYIPDEGLVDYVKHGTNVIGLINQYAGAKTNFCIILIKYYSKKNSNTMITFLQALKYAHSLNPDIIHYSGGGFSKSVIEKKIVKQILDDNIQLVVAAGNENINLDETCIYFPACYDKRIWVIGAKDFKSSNKGKIVDIYLNGKEQTAYGVTLTGTSQAAAIFTGMLLNQLSRLPSNAALNAIAKATYIQTGLKSDIKRLEKKHISKDIRKYTSWILTIMKAQEKKMIKYKWTF